nr:hypothetical protein BaRGS_024829 [Batillaria attramentaria]
MSFDVDWATAKAGFDDPHDTSRKGDFFIGLENLHIFTQQFRYWNKMNMNHDGGKQAIPKYYGFRVGPESSNYTLTYEYYEKQAGVLPCARFCSLEESSFFPALKTYLMRGDNQRAPAPKGNQEQAFCAV